MEVNKMKSKFSSKMMYVLCGALILISLFFIGRGSYTDYKEKKLLETIQEEQRKEQVNIKEVETQDDKKEEEILQREQVYEEQQILPQYKSLYYKNEDFYGWIRTDELDLPVMYTPQKGRENFYEYRNFEKEYSRSGSIYIDYRCEPQGNNYLIYGHNMKDLSMFGCLSSYKDESFYEKHRYIKFDTIYEEGEYEIISVSKAFIKPDDLEEPTIQNNSKVPYKEVSNEEYLFYNHVMLNTEEEFEEYVEWMKENSYYETNISAQYGDKLITLCTCTNTKKWQNERLLVVAKKIK